MATTFKIGTFNLFNLVNAEFTYYTDRRYSTDEYNAKVSWIAAQLDRMGVDIVGFQEAWHLDALEDAARRSSRNFQHVIANGADGSGPVVGLASTFPITAVESFTDIPAAVRLTIPGINGAISTFSRPVLKALVDVPDMGEIAVFVAHLKSKRPEYIDGEDSSDFAIQAVGTARSLARRAAEAVGLRALLLDLVQDTDTPVVVLGDLNDGNTSVTTNVIAGSPPFILWDVDGKQPYWDTLFYNVVNLQARRSIGPMDYTHIYNGQYEVLDYVLVSEELNRSNPDHKASFEYVHFFRDHLSDLLLSLDFADKTKSDHAQVVAQFQTRT